MNQNGILKNVQVNLVKHKNKGKKQKQQTEIKNLNIRLQCLKWSVRFCVGKLSCGTILRKFNTFSILLHMEK